ncbi:MAG: DUF89 family protein [Candidatus Saganbacteria bacterium]|nr:DUF89 family protein [Candidatus Saganbacteria bacterium]
MLTISFTSLIRRFIPARGAGQSMQPFLARTLSVDTKATELARGYVNFWNTPISADIITEPSLYTLDEDSLSSLRDLGWHSTSPLTYAEKLSERLFSDLNMDPASKRLCINLYTKTIEKLCDLRKGPVFRHEVEEIFFDLFRDYDFLEREKVLQKRAASRVVWIWTRKLSALETKKARFLALCKLSAAANAIDFRRVYRPGKLFDQIISEPEEGDGIDLLWEKVRLGKGRVLFGLNNASEAVVDSMLIKYLARAGLLVDVLVNQYTIELDATKSDCDLFESVPGVTIYATPSLLLGKDPRKIPPDLWQQSDIRIFKGQGSWQAMRYAGMTPTEVGEYQVPALGGKYSFLTKDCFFLFRPKASYVSKKEGFSEGLPLVIEHIKGIFDVVPDYQEQRDHYFRVRLAGLDPAKNLSNGETRGISTLALPQQRVRKIYLPYAVENKKSLQKMLEALFPEAEIIASREDKIAEYYRRGAAVEDVTSVSCTTVAVCLGSVLHHQAEADLIFYPLPEHKDQRSCDIGQQFTNAAGFDSQKIFASKMPVDFSSMSDDQIRCSDIYQFLTEHFLFSDAQIFHVLREIYSKREPRYNHYSAEALGRPSVEDGGVVLLMLGIDAWASYRSPHRQGNILNWLIDRFPDVSILSPDSVAASESYENLTCDSYWKMAKLVPAVREVVGQGLASGVLIVKPWACRAHRASLAVVKKEVDFSDLPVATLDLPQKSFQSDPKGRTVLEGLYEACKIGQIGDLRGFFGSSRDEGEFSLGIDIGSTLMKAVLVDSSLKIIFQRAISRRKQKNTQAFVANLSDEIERELRLSWDDLYKVGTGYGREALFSAGLVDSSVTELTAHGLAALLNYIQREDLPDLPMSVIDLGGNDAKFIEYSSSMVPTATRMSGTCRNSFGTFVDEVIPSVLPPAFSGDRYAEFDRLAGAAQDPASVHSFCVAMSKQTLAGLQASPEDKAKGVLDSLMRRALADVSLKASVFVLTGGLFNLSQAVASMQSEIRKRLFEAGYPDEPQVFVPENPQLIGAHGAAIWGFLQKERGK